MKLAGERAARFLRSPDPGLAGALLHGSDESAVASSQRILLDSLLGDDRAELDRLDPALIRRDPESLLEALRSRSFFGGRRVALVERATDTLAPVIENALIDIAPEDAFLLVTGRALGTRSPLRQLFEQQKSLASLIISAEPPGATEIAARLEAHGMRAELTENGRELLLTIAAGMDIGAFDGLLESIAIYALDRQEPIDADDIAALAPAGADIELDTLVAAIADGRAEQIGPLLQRVVASGATPVGLVLGMQRHFRQLLTVAGADGGLEAGLNRLRPRPFGARRDRMRSQVQRWHPERIELAVQLLFKVDSRLRSAERVPELAIVERCALRLAMMAGR